jgi:hypothetical protein
MCSLEQVTCGVILLPAAGCTGLGAQQAHIAAVQLQGFVQVLLRQVVVA